MKTSFTNTIILILATNVVLGQVSKTYQTNQGIETGYSNRIVTFDDGYFLLENTIVYPNPGKRELLISRFDNCHNEIWTKRYRSGNHVELENVLVDGEKLVILAGTGLKYPIIIFLGLDGEKIASYSYRHSNFDNHFNLKEYNNTYHFFGPSNGPSHYAIDNEGNILFANIISTNTDVSSTVPFGCTMLSNGNAIRRYGNVLIGVDQSQSILWAHQFSSINGADLNEREPTEVDDGFVILMDFDGATLVKFDYQGNVVWNSRKLNIYPSSVSVRYQSGVISIVSNTNNLESNRLALLEIEESTGDVVSSNYFEFEEFNGYSFPTHKISSNGDILISGSILIDFSNGEWEDMFLINPQLSKCHKVIAHPTEEPPIITYDDVTHLFELEPIQVEKNDHSIFVYDEPYIFFEKCNSLDSIFIDTSLDCSNTYLFDNPFPGSQYVWSDGSTDSVRQFFQSQSTSVMVKNCGFEKEVFLNIEEGDCPCPIYIPNIINVNSTIPENRSFSVKSACTFDLYEIYIFDRWGNMVFTSKDPSVEWYGQFKNKSVVQGVYVYSLRYSTSISDETIIKMGDIALIK